MDKIVIAGKTLKLTFTMNDWETMEDEICTVDELDKKLTEKGRIKIVYQLAALMAHDDIVTPDWLALNVKPYQFQPLIKGINQAIIKALTHKDDDNTVQDVGLEELQKNGAGAV